MTKNQRVQRVAKILKSNLATTLLDKCSSAAGAVVNEILDDIERSDDYDQSLVMVGMFVGVLLGCGALPHGRVVAEILEKEMR